MLDRPRLTVVEQQKLADALLNCECIRDRRVRDQLLQTLRQDSVGQHVSVSRQDLDRADVIGILNAFARHTGGLTALLSCVDLFEPGSVAAERLRVLIERIEPDPLLSGEQSASLESLLSTIDCPEAEDLYWESVGDFGPAPTGPGYDLVSLARDLGDVVSHGSVPPLLVFLELVASRTIGHRPALRQWINSHAAHLSIDPEEMFRHRVGAGERVTANAKAYLVVQLESHGADTQRYLPSAWFQRAGSSKKLFLAEEPILLEELASILNGLLTRDAEVTRDAASRLVVEIVVPRQLINFELDQLPIAPAGFARPLGTQHPVVIRPLERMNEPALYREWRRKWEWLKKHGHEARANARGIQWISHPRETDPSQLLVQLMVDDTPVCVIMAFPPPAADGLGSDEYAAGIHSGAPVMMWCRDERSAKDFEEEIRGLLADQGLLAIPDLVHRHRQRAHVPGASARHLGRQLTLLWDDFDRQPEMHSLLAPARGPR